jgi:hypothetical protein
MDEAAYALEIMADLEADIREACRELQAAGICLGAEYLLEELEAERERIERDCAEAERREDREMNALYERWAI